MREYKCFRCNISFTTSTKAPSCAKCGQVLKGRPVNGRGEKKTNYNPRRNYY